MTLPLNRGSHQNEQHLKKVRMSDRSSSELSDCEKKDKRKDTSRSPSRRKHKKSKHSKKKSKKKSSKKKKHRHRSRSRSKEGHEENRTQSKSHEEKSHMVVNPDELSNQEAAVDLLTNRKVDNQAATNQSGKSANQEEANTTFTNQDKSPSNKLAVDKDNGHPPSFEESFQNDRTSNQGGASCLTATRDVVANKVALGVETGMVGADEVKPFMEKHDITELTMNEEFKDTDVSGSQIYDPGLYIAKKQEKNELQNKDAEKFGSILEELSDAVKKSISGEKLLDLSNSQKEKSTSKERKLKSRSNERSRSAKDKGSRSNKERSRSKDRRSKGSRQNKSRSRSNGKRSRSRGQISRSKGRSRSASKSRSRSPAKRSRKRSRDKSRNRSSSSKRSKSRETCRENSKEKKEKSSHSRKTFKRSRTQDTSKDRRLQKRSRSRQKYGRSKSRERERSKSRECGRSRSKERPRSRSYERYRYKSGYQNNSHYRRSRSGDRRRRSRSVGRRGHSRSPERRWRSRSRGRGHQSRSKDRYRSRSPRKSDRSEDRKKRSQSGDPVAASVPVNLTIALGVTTTSVTTATADTVKSSKSIADFTALCKKLTESRDENGVSEDTIMDEETSQVYHPFSVKPAKDIVIPPMILPVTKPAEPARPLEQAFPVSSGNQHKTKENTNEATVEGIDGSVASAEKVFQAAVQTEKLDVSGLIAKRMEAQNRLQSNPHDLEARLVLEEVQMKIQNWASINLKPGQFTGENLVNSFAPKDNINSGYQAWARKDMFHNLAPIRGGVGMRLLQKMGWKPGQIIGKRGEGGYEPIALTVKTDRKGLVSFGEPGCGKGKGGGKGGGKNILAAQAVQGKHPVSALAELCTKRKWNTPTYNIVHESGPSHKKDFLFQVVVNANSYQHNVASNNKKLAKAEAAFAALKALGVVPADATMTL